MNSDHMMLSVALVAVAVALIGVGFTYSTVSDYNDWITGFAFNANGTVEILVTSNAAINFTTAVINWSNGTILSGFQNATLNSSGVGSVSSGGSWVNQTGLIIENIGNVNVTLDIFTTKNAAQFLGGTNPLYQYNVSNNEAGSCRNLTQGLGGNNVSISTWRDVNTTNPGTRVCDFFTFFPNNDTIRIDITIRVPEDTPVKDQALQDTIVVTGTATA